MWNNVFTFKERKMLAAEYEERLRREREGTAGQPSGRPGSSTDAAPAAPAALKPGDAKPQQIFPSVLELCADEDSEFGMFAERYGLQHTRITELDDLTSNEGVTKALKAARNYGTLCIISLPCTGGSNWQKANGNSERGLRRIAEHRKKFSKLLRATHVVADAVMKNGGYLIFELPRNNAYWKESEVKEFLNRYGLIAANFDGCCFGLKAKKWSAGKETVEDDDELGCHSACPRRQDLPRGASAPDRRRQAHTCHRPLSAKAGQDRVARVHHIARGTQHGL